MSHSSSSASSRHHRFDVEPLRVRDRALGLGQSHQDRAGALEELRGVVADVSQSLDHDPLALQSRREAERLHVLPHGADLAHAVEHTPARGLHPPADSARAHRLRGDTAECVELARAKLGVRVGDPGHFSWPGAHVRRGDVEAGADEILACQLEDVAPRDPLQLRRRVPLGVEPDSALGTTERHVHQRALVGHQCRQCLHFLRVHGLGVADAALGGELVMAVLRPPRVHHLDAAVIPLDGKAGIEEVLAGLDVGEERGVVPGVARGAIEGAIHLLEETGTE